MIDFSIYSSLLKLPDRLTRKPGNAGRIIEAEGYCSISASVYLSLGKRITTQKPGKGAFNVKTVNSISWASILPRSRPLFYSFRLNFFFSNCPEKGNLVEFDARAKKQKITDSLTKSVIFQEASTGVEPVNDGFANRCLSLLATTPEFNCFIDQFNDLLNEIFKKRKIQSIRPLFDKIDFAKKINFKGKNRYKKSNSSQ